MLALSWDAIVTILAVLIVNLAQFGLREATSRKYDNEGAAKLTGAAIELMEQTKAELSKVKANQKAVLEILSLQKEEMQELWGEYEKLYSLASIMHHQLKSQGIIPASELPSKRRRPVDTITYDFDKS